MAFAGASVWLSLAGLDTLTRSSAQIGTAHNQDYFGNKPRQPQVPRYGQKVYKNRRM